MTTDFRALCAELHAAFTTYAVDECHHNLLERARAALAEPEPEGPTLDDIWELCEEHGFVLGIDGAHEDESAEGLLSIARAVLARWGRPESVPNPWKDTLLDALVCNFLLNAENEDDPRKALSDLIAWEKQLAVDPLINPPRQPVSVSERLPRPEGPTDDELDDMANEAGLDLAWRPELRRFARFALARTAAAILQPIPVSKELPWELDCDAEGRCWWGRSESNDWSADWTLATHEAVAEFCEFSPQTVWLPAWALPLPKANDVPPP